MVSPIIVARDIHLSIVCRNNECLWFQVPSFILRLRLLRTFSPIVCPFLKYQIAPMARPRVQIDGHLLLRGYWIVRTYENLVDKEAVHLERRLSRIENDLDETANGRTQQKAANPGDDGDAAARKAMQNQELAGSAAQRPDGTEGDDAARADLQNQNNDDRTGEEDTERLNSGAVADHDQDAQSTQTTEVPDLPYPIEPYETKNINDPDPRPSLRNGRQRFSSVDQDAAKGANRKKGKSSVDKSKLMLEPRIARKAKAIIASLKTVLEPSTNISQRQNPYSHQILGPEVVMPVQVQAGRVAGPREY